MGEMMAYQQKKMGGMPWKDKTDVTFVDSMQLRNYGNPRG
jgi:hypothetical protein